MGMGASLNCELSGLILRAFTLFRSFVLEGMIKYFCLMGQVFEVDLRLPPQLLHLVMVFLI